jgi:CBS domain-containing protein
MLSSASVRQAAGDFLVSSRGSTATEYAIFVGLIVGLALFGSELLGVAARKTFAQTAEALGGDAAHAQPAIRPAAPAAAAPPATGSDGIAWLQLAGAAIVLAGGGAAWWFLYARRVEKEKAEEAALEAAMPAQNLFKKRQAILGILSGDSSRLMDNSVTVGQLMSAKLTTVTVLLSTPLPEIRKLMVEGRRRHLLVADEVGKLLGVISDRDLKKKAATVAELMTPKPVAVSSTTLIGPAATILLERQISCLPVVDGDRLVGVLTTSDLIMALQCTLQVLCKIAVAARTESADACRVVTTAA